MTKKRKPDGSGSIYLDKGKHRARLPGGARKPAGRYKTREEAQAVLDTILLTAQEADLTGYSFRTWGEVWLGLVENLPSYRSIKSNWKPLCCRLRSSRTHSGPSLGYRSSFDQVSLATLVGHAPLGGVRLERL